MSETKPLTQEPQTMETESKTRGISGIGSTVRQDSLESRMGQLEAKMESVIDKVERGIETRKWILLAILAAIGSAVAGGTVLYNLFINYPKSYIELQNTYYRELVELRKEMSNINDKRKQQELNQIAPSKKK